MAVEVRASRSAELRSSAHLHVDREPGTAVGYLAHGGRSS